MTVTGFLRSGGVTSGVPGGMSGGISGDRNFPYLCGMEYNDYCTHLKLCEFLGKPPMVHFRKVYDFLTELWNDIEIVVDPSTNRIVFQKGGNWYFEQDLKYGELKCDYERVWSFFRSDMGMELTETKEFIKSTVDEHLKCEVGTPFVPLHDFTGMVDEHLKCEVGTLECRDLRFYSSVEEHLKCEVMTT